MIYEYALQPSLVVDWADQNTGRFVGQFGMDQRRLVSEFPNDWAGEVYSEALSRFDYDDRDPGFLNLKSVLEAFIQVLSDCMIPRKINSQSNWISDVLNEHRVRPFHAIFVSERPSESPPEVITEKDIDNLHDKRWYLPTIKTTPKSSEQIAESLLPFLRGARKLILVDPYFDPEVTRFKDTLTAMVNKITKFRNVTGLPDLIIITSAEQKHKLSEGEFTLIQKNNVAGNLYRKAEDHLAKLIPNNWNISFIVTSEVCGGDASHNRYLLSDIGGVVIPFGADDFTRNPTLNVDDDIVLMPKGMFDKRWQQYSKFDPARVVGNILQIKGQKT